MSGEEGRNEAGAAGEAGEANPIADRFDSIGDEIADLLRTSHEASLRLQADADAILAQAESEARARVDEAAARAAEVHAELDARRAAFDNERAVEFEVSRQAAKTQLEEAAAMLRETEERCEQERREAGVFAQATMAEATERHIEATRHRDDALAILQGSIAIAESAAQRAQLLAAESTSAGADLTELRSALELLAQRHGTLGGELGVADAVHPMHDLQPVHAVHAVHDPAESTRPAPSPGVDAPIDLREEAPGGIAPEAAAPTGLVDDQLAAAVQTAVARAMDTSVIKQDERPAPPSSF